MRQAASPLLGSLESDTSQGGELLIFISHFFKMKLLGLNRFGHSVLILSYVWREGLNTEVYLFISFVSKPW